MNISILAFMHFATYQGLFDYVDLENAPTVLTALHDDPESAEYLHFEGNRVWYKRLWELESIRREAIQEASNICSQQVAERDARRNKWKKIFDSL